MFTISAFAPSWTTTSTTPFTYASRSGCAEVSSCTSVNREPGSATTSTRQSSDPPGTPLATLIPANATLEAHLYSPSRSIGFVHQGQDVLLRYLAYPHQKFGMHKASVVAVSKNPLLPSELGFTPSDGLREPVYRIRVALESQAVPAYGNLERLQAGMQVEADILLDRRLLIEWIFETLLSLAGRA